LAAQRVSKRISHRSAVALPPRRLPEDAQSQKWPSTVNSALRTTRNLQLWMLTWLSQTEPRGKDRMANGERTRWKKQ
jgi:hypothetical protein